MVRLLTPPSEPKPYLVRRNDKMVLNADLFEKRARPIAEELVAANLNNTQLRRFFSPVVELKNKVLAGSISNEELKAELALLKARAAYAKKRPGVKVPDALVRLFTEHAHWVDDGRELLLFARHFEAIVAYHRALMAGRGQEESP
jgi:CRISPR-associated protein Csm2